MSVSRDTNLFEEANDRSTFALTALTAQSPQKSFCALTVPLLHLLNQPSPRQHPCVELSFASSLRFHRVDTAATRGQSFWPGSAVGILTLL